jgi:hypothetical protein
MAWANTVGNRNSAPMTRETRSTRSTRMKTGPLGTRMYDETWLRAVSSLCLASTFGVAKPGLGLAQMVANNGLLREKTADSGVSGGKGGFSKGNQRERKLLEHRAGIELRGSVRASAGGGGNVTERVCAHFHTHVTCDKYVLVGSHDMWPVHPTIPSFSSTLQNSLFPFFFSSSY